MHLIFMTTNQAIEMKTHTKTFHNKWHMANLLFYSNLTLFNASAKEATHLLIDIWLSGSLDLGSKTY